MRQDYFLFRLIRNLLRLAGIDGLRDLARAATYRLKNRLISERHR